MEEDETMLTLNSRFTNFSKRPNAVVTAADLDLLKNIISTDLVNFRGNISYGFTEGIATKIVSRIKVFKDAKICVVNDTSFHMTLKLIEAGYDPANIYIAVGKWKVAGKRIVPDKNDSTLKILKRHAEASFAEKLNIISLEDMFNLKFNLIIANPPYGKIGADITKVIISEAEFDEYVNLEPVVDYLRHKEIWTHLQLGSVQLVEGFDGAHVLPSIATFSKAKTNNLSYDDFYVETISNNLTYKFFKENSVRSTSVSFDENTTDISLNFDYRLIFGIKVAANSFNHADKTTINVAGTKRSTPYALNYGLTTLKEYYETKKSKAFWGVILTFATKEERCNAFNFVYSDLGAKFLNALAFSMKRDNYHAKEYLQLFPKVDWTRSWTVEEILADYGYADAEIAEVMTDLENFRGMEG
jgi:hypothetical protein